MDFGYQGGGSGQTIVEQDTFEIFDNGGAPASDDGYVKVALSTVFPAVPRVVGSKVAESDPAFIPSANGKLLIQPNYQFGAASITFPNATIAAQPALRLNL